MESMTMTYEEKSSIEEKIIKSMEEFTKTTPMASITTGMLNLLIKPKCTKQEFADILDHMEHKGLMKSAPKGRSKRWQLAT